MGVSFETLQTEYWIASYDAIEDELAARGFDMIEAIADGDANRQLEQIHNFIVRKVDGIIVVPKDARTVIPGQSGQRSGHPGGPLQPAGPKDGRPVGGRRGG